MVIDTKKMPLLSFFYEGGKKGQIFPFLLIYLSIRAKSNAKSLLVSAILKEEHCIQ